MVWCKTHFNLGVNDKCDGQTRQADRRTEISKCRSYTTVRYAVKTLNHGHDKSSSNVTLSWRHRLVQSLVINRSVVCLSTVASRTQSQSTLMSTSAKRLNVTRWSRCVISTLAPLGTIR